MSRLCGVRSAVARPFREAKAAFDSMEESDKFSTVLSSVNGTVGASAVVVELRELLRGSTGGSVPGILAMASIDVALSVGLVVAMLHRKI